MYQTNMFQNENFRKSSVQTVKIITMFKCIIIIIKYNNHVKDHNINNS